jgi:hypothetical protein
VSAKAPRKAPAKRAAPRKAARKVAARTGGSKAAAAKAVERAKDAGALGPGGSNAQRHLRDGAIVVSLAAGRTQAEVASEFAVSERTVRLAKERAAKAPSLLDEVPMAIVEEMLRSMRRLIADFYVMAYRHADANPSVAVAALKGAHATQERLLELLTGLGKLPEDMELFRAESELRAVADRMLETMELVVAGELTVEDAGEVFRLMTQQSPGRPRLQAVE